MTEPAAEAAMAGYRVKYVFAARLVNEPVEAADDMVLTKTIVRYGRVDLLCIDELGLTGSHSVVFSTIAGVWHVGCSRGRTF